VSWLILGGSGQLGRAMSAKLKAEGAHYTVLSHSDLDITNLERIQEAISRYDPDVLINAAAWTNVELAQSDYAGALNVNAIGPMYLARSCSFSGAKFIHISTDFVFSGTRSIPWTENSAKNPTSNYGKSKSLGEDFVLEAYPKGSIIVRTSWLYSPWGKNFVKTMAKIALNESREVRVVSDQIGQPTSAIELANQIYLMVVEGVHPGIYHASNAGETSWYEFAKEIFLELKRDSGRVKPITSTEFESSVHRPAYGVLSYENLIKQGIKPMQNWRDALNESLPSIIKAIE